MHEQYFKLYLYDTLCMRSFIKESLCLLVVNGDRSNVNARYTQDSRDVATSVPDQSLRLCTIDSSFLWGRMKLASLLARKVIFRSK